MAATVVEQQMHAALKICRTFNFFVIINSVDVNNDTKSLVWLRDSTRHSFTYYLRHSNNNPLKSAWSNAGATTFQHEDELRLPCSAGVFVVRVMRLSDLCEALHMARVLQGLAMLPTCELHPTPSVCICRSDLRQALKAYLRPEGWRIAGTSFVTRLFLEQHMHNIRDPRGIVIVNGWFDATDATLVDRWQSAMAAATHPNVHDGSLVVIVCPTYLEPAALEFWGMCMVQDMCDAVGCFVWPNGAKSSPEQEIFAINRALSVPVIGVWPINIEGEQHGWLITLRAFAQCRNTWSACVNTYLARRAQIGNKAQISVRTEVNAKVEFW